MSNDRRAAHHIYYEKNKLKISQKNKDRMRDDPEYRKHRQELARKSYNKHKIERCRRSNNRKRDDPEYKQKHREYYREYYEANKERLKKVSRKYYKEHVEECHQYGKKYRAENAEYIKRTKKKIVYCDICDTYGQHTSVRQHERTLKHQRNRHIRNKDLQ